MAGFFEETLGDFWGNAKLSGGYVVDLASRVDNQLGINVIPDTTYAAKEAAAQLAESRNLSPEQQAQLAAAFAKKETTAALVKVATDSGRDVVRGAGKLLDAGVDGAKKVFDLAEFALKALPWTLGAAAVLAVAFYGGPLLKRLAK